MSQPTITKELPNHTTQRAAVVVRGTDDYSFSIQTVPKPIPGPSEVLIKLSLSGVCGTDFHLAAGLHGPTCTILGHEGVGRVSQLGSAVTGIRIGQRIGVAWQRDVCGICSFCLVDGGETRCAAQITSGRNVDGTFAEYTVVPERYLMPLPEGLADEQIAPILCGGVTMYKALLISGVKAGQWVAISGAGGGVGSLGIQYAKAMGLLVVALDAGEEKKDFCLRSGADSYVDVVSSADVVGEVLKTTGNKGANAVLVTAGSGRAYQDGLKLLAPFGTLVCVGIPPPADTAEFHALDFIDRGIRIIGSAVGTRGDILDALAFVARGQVTPVVTVVDLTDLRDVTQKFKRGELIGKYVLQISEPSIECKSKL